MNFSTCFDVTGLKLALGCRSHSTSFEISQKGNLTKGNTWTQISPCIVVELVCPWGKASQGLLFQHFTDLLPYFAVLTSMLYVREFIRSLVVLVFCSYLRGGPKWLSGISMA